MHNKTKDAAQMAANREMLMEAGYRLFTKRTIDGVSLEEVAKAAGIGVATLYRYFGSKADLAAAISVWKWEEYLMQLPPPQDAVRQQMTGAENFAFYLDSFLKLYRDHQDMLRFNQFFNVYLQGNQTDRASMIPFEQMVSGIGERFRLIWEKGERDGTLRTEIPWKQAFSATMHVMLAAVTRYAVGLVYQQKGGLGPEEELSELREMIMEYYSR